ncbi:cell division protein [Alphaproteobacteria bacterium]|nr:cell division protein [Alphaproteobacteria bacterium]
MIKSAPALPLSRDAASRFLPWLIAFMVWLATLALAAVMVLSAAGDQWRRSLTGSVTVQIIPATNNSPQSLQRNVEKALTVLRASSQVVSAAPIATDKVAELLEPWIGNSALSRSLKLPIPRLIDVTLTPSTNGTTPDTRLLSAQIAAEVPGATLDDHGRWLDQLLSLARAIEIVAFAVLGLISLAAITTIVFATRTGLAIHHDVIELLHLMGAQDDYVARQFQLNAFLLGLKGGATGVIIAMATLLATGSIAAEIEAGLLPPVSMTLPQWAALFSVGASTVVICLITTRITVLRTIGRMA